MIQSRRAGYVVFSCKAWQAFLPVLEGSTHDIACNSGVEYARSGGENVHGIGFPAHLRRMVAQGARPAQAFWPCGWFCLTVSSRSERLSASRGTSLVLLFGNRCLSRRTRETWGRDADDARCSVVDVAVWAFEGMDALKAAETAGRVQRKRGPLDSLRSNATLTGSQTALASG